MVRFRARKASYGWNVVDDSIGYVVAYGLTARGAMLMVSRLNEEEIGRQKNAI